MGPVGWDPSCDNPWCVNPLHLEPGDQKKNIQDMCLRNRHTHSNKITPDVVREIRDASGTPKEIAARYGITATHVRYILRRKRWAFLP